MSEFPSYRNDMSDRQRHAIERVWQDAARTAKQNDGGTSYRLNYVEMEEMRYDAERDELVGTGKYLTWTGPQS